MTVIIQILNGGSAEWYTEKLKRMGWEIIREGQEIVCSHPQAIDSRNLRHLLHEAGLLLCNMVRVNFS